MWEEVAIVLAEQDPKDKRKLTMAKFDCEEVRRGVNKSKRSGTHGAIFFCHTLSVSRLGSVCCT